MTTKQNKEWARQITQSFNEIAGDVSKVRALGEKYYAPGFIYHPPFGGDMNWEQAGEHVVTLVSAFPNLNYSNDDVLAEGDKVAIRYTMKATHKGTFLGIPATGKQIVMKGVEIDKIVEGKCVETWHFPDYLGMMTQLGVVPGSVRKT
jgi:hypothetical protein